MADRCRLSFYILGRKKICKNGGFMPDDYGYFGTGDTGYAHYVAASGDDKIGNEGGGGGGGSHKGGSGSGCGCYAAIAIFLFIAYLVGSMD